MLSSYPNGSPNTNSKTINLSLELSVEDSLKSTPKRTSSELYGGTRQQGFAKIPAKLSAYQIHSLIPVLIV
jgi:hypothetical protein